MLRSGSRHFSAEMAHEFATPSEPVVNELAEIDHILTRPRDALVRSADQLYCQLPPCSLVRKSRRNQGDAMSWGKGLLTRGRY